MDGSRVATEKRGLVTDVPRMTEGMKPGDGGRRQSMLYIISLVFPGP
jgi:hypothetical protein